MGGLTLVTPAASYPVTLTEAKANCRVIGTDEDTFLNGLIASATAYVEAYTGCSIEAQTWDYTIDAFADEIDLPRGPLISVDSITYLDPANASQTLATGWLEDLPGERVLRDPDASWPAISTRKNAVTIQFTSGYDTVPASIKQAILLLIGDWFRNRENTIVGQTTSEPPHAVTALLTNHRRFGL